MTSPHQLAVAHGTTGKQSEKLVFNAVFTLLVVAALVLFGLNYSDPNDFRWLWIIALACISLLQMSARAVVLERVSFDRLELSLLGFAAYAALSLSWTPDPLAGYALLSKIGILAVVFLCLKNAGNDEWFSWLCAAIAAAAALVTGFAFFNVGYVAGYGNTNFVTEFLILAVPFVATLAFIYSHKAVRAAVAALIFSILIYLFFFNISRIEFLVLAGMSFVAIVTWGWQRNRWLALAGALAIIGVVAAAAIYFWEGGHGFRVSIYPRLAMLIDTLWMWWDKPLLGQGAGSFNFLYFLYQERHLDWMDIDTGLFRDKSVISGAAHNEYAQLLATFGLIGTALVGVFSWFLLRGLRGRAMTPYAWCGLSATGVWMLNALVEFPLQSPATALLAVIGLGFLARHGQTNTNVDAGLNSTSVASLFTLNLNQAAKIFVLLGATILSGLAGYGGYRFDAGSQCFSKAAANLNIRPDYAFAQNYEAYQLYPWDTYIRLQLYITTVRWKELEGKVPLSPEELDRIFDISVKASPNTALLLARMQYLLNSRMYQKDQRYAQELQQGFGLLLKNASRKPDVRLLNAYYHIAARDFTGAAAEVDVAEKMELNEIQKAILDKLRNALESGANTQQPLKAAEKSRAAGK